LFYNSYTIDFDKNINIQWKQIHPGVGKKYDTELAMTGHAFSVLRDYCTDHFQKQSFYQLIARTHVYAEMLASQKAELVQDLKDMDYTVAMIGDGSNDSMALNASDVGVSISDAETSFAAQFTVEKGGGNCAELVQDGRALLDKILYSVKFVIVFVFIQFAVILHNQLRVPKQPQWIWSNLFMGLCLTLSGMYDLFILIYLVSFNTPATKLHKQRPPRYVIRLPMLISVIGQIIIQVACLTAVMVFFKYSKWYHDFEFFFGYNGTAQDIANSYVFLFSNFQYLAVAFAFQFNYRYITPWRNCKC
jgi:cation-transporting ATPase 13A3/4/5